MNENDINITINQLQKRIQFLADQEGKAAWAKFIGVTSDKIDFIASGGLNIEKEYLIDKIDRLLSEMEEICKSQDLHQRKEAHLKSQTP